MGTYINKGNEAFQVVRNGEFVDESGLIAEINRTLETERMFCCVPRKNIQSPAIVIELKYNKTANTAIDQIKQKQYPDKLAEYTGEVLLAGISYDRETKTHECEIEHYTKK